MLDIIELDADTSNPPSFEVSERRLDPTKEAWKLNPPSFEDQPKECSLKIGTNPPSGCTIQ